MFNVLLALADGEKHGYAILREVTAQTGDETALGAGTLYAIIKRLLVDGLIVEVRDRPSSDQEDQRRRYYRLTPAGREAAVAEAARLEKVLARARRAIKVFHTA
jgi:DNA-binding PadR family transcriptional regulator